MVNLTVEFVDTTLKKQGPFVIRVFNFILDAMFRLSAIKEQENAQVYNEAVKETRRMFSYQLQRLALRGANHLVVCSLPVYVRYHLLTKLLSLCTMILLRGLRSIVKCLLCMEQTRIGVLLYYLSLCWYA